MLWGGGVLSLTWYTYLGADLWGCCFLHILVIPWVCFHHRLVIPGSFSTPHRAHIIRPNHWVSLPGLPWIKGHIAAYIGHNPNLSIEYAIFTHSALDWTWMWTIDAANWIHSASPELTRTRTISSGVSLFRHLIWLLPLEKVEGKSLTPPLTQVTPPAGVSKQWSQWWR